MVSGPEPLSPEDATLLCATTPAMQLIIGALCRVEGGPLRDVDGSLRLADLRNHVGARLHLVPRFRQRVQRVPFDLARPVWVDDVDFDLDRHVHGAELPAPGGTTELRCFVDDLLGRPLEPAHPMWDLWVVDGLDGGDVAVVLRAHHVVADGLSLLRAAMALLDLDRGDGSPPDASPPWRPTAAPRTVALAGEAVVGRARRQLGLLAGTALTLLDPRRSLPLARVGVGAVASPPRPAPAMPVTGPVGTRREFRWASLPLEPLHRAAHARGATLNDAVLAAVTGALRRTLGPDAAAALSGSPPKVLVPVGDAGPDGGSGNRFSFVVVELPVHLDAPESVLDHIHREMRNRATSRQADHMLSLFSVVDVVPVPLLRGLAPGMLARQPFVNVAVTDVPGSPAPLYLLGSRILEMHPFVTGVGNLACIVAALSYDDHLGVGITVDPDVVAEPDRLLEDLIEVGTELTRLGP